MDKRLEKLSQMLEHHYRTWVELFKNEETGQEEHMERMAPDRLVITPESDNGEPLLYALRQCFENMEIDLNVLN